MVKILAIGNSFSRDATCYLHQIAESAGVETKVVNLYIGGCPLERHWQNIEKDTERYIYQVNGIITDRYVTIDEALEEEEWDYVVTQQASHDSGWIGTYDPFLGLLIEHVRKKVPNAVFVMHETWAYEPDSNHGCFVRYNCNQQQMYETLRTCYREMAEKYQLPMIPCGDVVQEVRKLDPFNREKGGMSLCRDGFHMNFIYGRYLLACVWAKKLLNITLEDNCFVPKLEWSEKPVDMELLEIIRKAVDDFEM